MKCGVIFYFVSLDSLEITHSILKDSVFQLSKMRDPLASGQKNIFPATLQPPSPPLPRRLPPLARFSGYMSVLAFAINYSNSFWNAGLHFEWLVQRQESFFPPSLLARGKWALPLDWKIGPLCVLTWWRSAMKDCDKLECLNRRIEINALSEPGLLTIH